MIRRPPRSTRTDTLFPYTTLFRSAAVFVKDVKNLVLTSYYDMPAVVTQSDGSTRPITLAVAQPMNTEKATLKGVEAGFQQALDFLPGPLSHLGFQVNYTHIWSDKVVLDQGDRKSVV